MSYEYTDRTISVVTIVCDVCHFQLRTLLRTVADARKVAEDTGWAYDRFNFPKDICLACSEDIRKAT